MARPKKNAVKTTITTTAAPVVASPLLQAVVQQEVQANKSPLGAFMDGKKTLAVGGAGFVAGLLGWLQTIPLEKIIETLVGTGPRASITMMAVSAIMMIMRGFTKAPIMQPTSTVVAAEPSKVVTQYNTGPGSIQ